MALSEAEKHELSQIAGGLYAAHSYMLFAVIAALAERGVVSQDRVVVWANTFAEMFQNNIEHPYRLLVAQRLREFATSLETMSTPPDQSGRA